MVSPKRPEVDNHPRWKVSQKRPDRRLPSPRKLRTPTARYRRSVPSETGQATYASHQTDPKTKVSPERPLIALSPSWSVRRLVAPAQCGTRDKTWVPYQPATKMDPPGVCGAWPLLAVWDPWSRPKPRRPSVLQTSELREYNLLDLPSIQRRRELSHDYAPDTPDLPHIEGLKGHGAVDSVTKVPSIVVAMVPPGVRHLAAPRSMGPAVFSGSPPSHKYIWSLLECARGFPGFTANPQHTPFPAAPRSVFPGFTHHERPSCTESSAKMATQP